ncbi:hypothetical protein V6N13_098427 [Hibiscus sabdariffa]
MASLRFLPHRESTAEPRGMSTGGSSGSISSSFCLSDVFFSQKMNVHENVVRILLLSQLYGENGFQIEESDQPAREDRSSLKSS